MNLLLLILASFSFGMDIKSSGVLPGGVGTTQLADSAVTTAKIAGSAVDTAKLGSGAVNTGKILTGAVTTAAIVDGAIDTNKLGSGSVDTSKLKADAGGFGVWSAWTPTFTGFSADPTGYVARYAQFGKIVVVAYTLASAGTSNTTSFSLTLPVAAKSTVQSGGLSPYDNTAYAQPGCFQTTAASTTLVLQKTCGTNASWTGSGAKDAAFTFVYEAN